MKGALMIRRWAAVLLAAVVVSVTTQASAMHELSLNNAVRTALDGVCQINQGRIVKLCSGDSVHGAIDENGVVYIWGDDRLSLSRVPQGLPPVTDLAIGKAHAVALDENGVLHGWGTPQNGELGFLGERAILPRMAAVAASGTMTIALSMDGRIYQWGGNTDDELMLAPDITGVTHVKAGHGLAAAITDDGAVHLWGGEQRDNAPHSGPDGAMDVAVLDGYAVALDAQGGLHGEVPHWSLNQRYLTMPETDEQIASIAGHTTAIAAVTDGGQLLIVGQSPYGDRTDSCLNVPENLPPIVQATFSGDSIACLGANGTVYQWGNDALRPPCGLDGALQEPLRFQSPEPVNIPDSITAADAEGFLYALQSGCRRIIVDGDIFVEGQSAVIDKGRTLVINPGATLTVRTESFQVQGNLDNRGTIGVESCLQVFDSGIALGEITLAEYAKVELILYEPVSVDRIARLLAGDSPFTQLTLAVDAEAFVRIDRDLTIPEGKTLSIPSGTLWLEEGATLTIGGMVWVAQLAQIDGIVEGFLDCWY